MAPTDDLRPEPATPFDQALPEPRVALADAHVGEARPGRERRSQSREGVGWPATCTNADGFSWQALIVDHSTGGLGLAECPPLHVDEVISIDVMSIGCFRCRVAWSSRTRCGVQFIPDSAEPTDGEQSALASGLEHAPRMSDGSSSAAPSSTPPTTLRARLGRLVATMLAKRSPCPTE